MPSASVSSKVNPQEPTMESITLVGSDGGSIKVDPYFAKYSRIIEVLLDPDNMFEESQTRTITFPTITTRELEMVVRYFEHMEAQLPSDTPRPDFVIPPEVAMDLMLVSDFLDI